MEQFDSMLSSVIDPTPGLRCRLFGYQYLRYLPDRNKGYRRVIEGMTRDGGE